MCATPKAVLISVGHNEQMKIIKILACGESWKIARPNGNQANGDTGRSICTIGLMIFITILLEPISMPMGIAIRLPKPKPMPTRLMN